MNGELEQNLDSLRARLLSLASGEHARFVGALMPTVPAERILGVKLPALRDLAQWIDRQDLTDLYLNALPPEYLEDELLMGFTLMRLRDPVVVMARLDALLPHLSSWASTDSLLPPVFRKAENHAKLMARIEASWLQSGHEYTVRYALRAAMAFLLPSQPSRVLDYARAAQHPGHYVRMMRGWLLAEAMVLHASSALERLRGGDYPPEVVRIAVRKARESRRVSPAVKMELQRLARSL